MTSPVYIGLVHYPVVNKRGDLVTTSVTNFDLHDLSRTATTFGIERYFVITPNQAQKNMVEFIKDYWQRGFGATYNPDRCEALKPMEWSASIKDTRLTIENIHDKAPRLIATTARLSKKSLKFNDLRVQLQQSNQPVLLLFGTGWGLASTVLDEADDVLEPIVGKGNFNHLPVRSAVAIILDRLLGQY